MLPKFTLLKKLWGTNGSLLLLLSASTIMVFAMLTSNELWTMESRWAAVTMQMLLRHDYLHPMLYTAPYYDKPLLSYWLILGFAKLLGHLDEWALRLPSALAAITTVYCTYRIGTILYNRSTGLTAGWLLITLFFFDFWGRTSSADMLNVAGIALAVFWYLKRKPYPNFLSYAVFFTIIALTCLCKGLTGALPLLLILPDLLMNQEWKKLGNLSLLCAALLGLGIYLLPFFLSAYSANQTLQNTGLIEVFRENLQRFFAPFDHAEPFYIYLIYLPIYLLPWTIFFIPAIGHNLWHWRQLNFNQRWLNIIIFILLLVFSLSGSKRGYYILPALPFAVLLTADWLNRYLFTLNNWAARIQNVTWIIYVLLFAWFAIIQPWQNPHNAGIWAFAVKVQQQATLKKPWDQWEITALPSAHDSSAIFYLQPKHEITPVNAAAVDRHKIIIATAKDLAQTKPILNNYHLIMENETSLNASMALIPRN